MPHRSPRACTGCGATVPAGLPCPDCETARRALDRSNRRDTLRPYFTRAHRRRFRQGVLDRDPLCVLCGKVATIADHYPRTRRQLVEDGDDPNDPAHGRGLCKACHDRHTAATSPGGWNRRP